MIRSLLQRRGGLAKDTAWAGATEIINLVSSLGIFFILTNQLGPSGYGLYAGIQAFAAIVATFATHWVPMLVLQEIIRERRSPEGMLAMGLGSAVVGGGLAVVLAAIVGPMLLGSGSWQLIAAFAAAEVLGVALVQVSAGAVQSVRGFTPAARMRAAFRIARLLAVVALVLFGPVSLAALAATLIAANVCSAAAALAYTSRSLDVRVRLALPSWPDLRSGLSYGGVLAAFGVQEDSDKALMVRYSTTFDAGLYAAGYRAVQVALMPVRAILASSHNNFLVDEGVKGQHLRRSLRYSALAGAYGLVASAALVVGAPLAASVLGAEYDETVDVIRWVAILVVLRALSQFPFNGLMGMRRNGVRVTILVVSAGLNVIATALLIPLYSWRGAAAATIGTEVLLLLTTWGALVHYQRRADADIDTVATAPDGAGSRPPSTAPEPVSTTGETTT